MVWYSLMLVTYGWAVSCRLIKGKTTGSLNSAMTADTVVMGEGDMCMTHAVIPMKNSSVNRGRHPS